MGNVWRRQCGSYGWEYIFTFKEGRTPTAFAEARDLMEQPRRTRGRLSGMTRRGGGSSAVVSREFLTL